MSDLEALDFTTACGNAAARRALAYAAGDSRAAALAYEDYRQSYRRLEAAVTGPAGRPPIAADLAAAFDFDPFAAFAAAYVETYFANLPTGARP